MRKSEKTECERGWPLRDLLPSLETVLVRASDDQSPRRRRRAKVITAWKTRFYNSNLMLIGLAKFSFPCRRTAKPPSLLCMYVYE